MTRDMELVRKILLKLEERRAGDYNPFSAGAFPPWSNSVVEEHIVILVEAGLIDGTPVPETNWGTSIKQFMAIRLTWAGHEFLAASKEPVFWEGARAQAGNVFSSLPLEVLKALLIDVAKKAVGLP